MSFTDSEVIFITPFARTIRLFKIGNFPLTVRLNSAEAERFMQPLGKALKTAQIQGRPWQQELNRFLLQYRTAPHSTTGVPPSELLFNRTVTSPCTNPLPQHH